MSLARESLTALLASYDRAPRAPQLLRDSIDRATYRIDGLIVKLYRRTQVAGHHARVLERLLHHGVPAPRLVRTLTGATLASADGWTAVAMTDVGEPCATNDAAAMRALGDISARLHTTPTEGIADSPFTLANERARARANVVLAEHHRLPDLELVAPALLDAFAELRDLDAMPRGVIHTDVAVVNAVVDARGTRTLVDWDDAGVGACVIDIGYALVHGAIDITSEPHWMPEYARAFLDAYRQHRTLTSDELAALPDAMAFGSLIYVIAEWVPEIWPREWARACWVRSHRAQILDELAR